MEDVIFYDDDETTAGPARPVARPKESLLSRLVIKSGLAKTVAQAEQVMLVIAITALLGAVGVIILGYFPIGSSPATPSEVSAATARIELQQLQAEQANQAAQATAK